MNSPLSADTRKSLQSASVATICTALYKRGLAKQFIQDVHPLSTRPVNMVGPAFTLRYIPAREDLNPMSVFQNPQHPQRVAVEQCPEGAVMVVDSRCDARAASAGSILITRLMARGCEGFVTDGGLRDSPAIAEFDIRCYHNRPAAPTNLTRHQAIDMNLPIGCGEAPVWPGDIIVGDNEGVVVIPAHMADEIAAETSDMELFERFVTQEVQRGQSIIGLYPPTREQSNIDFETWKKNKN